MSTTIESIEALAKTHAAHREDLSERVATLNAELDAVKNRHLRGLRASVARAKASRLDLHNAIDGGRELFEKPKSRILHGIKVGLKKGAGKVSFDDADQVVKLIERHLAEQADVLIITEKKPSKEAIANLPASDLKRIGCQVSDTSNFVLIKPADSAVDKLVKALLDGQEETEQE